MRAARVVVVVMLLAQLVGDAGCSSPNASAKRSAPSAAVQAVSAAASSSVPASAVDALVEDGVRVRETTATVKISGTEALRRASRRWTDAGAATISVTATRAYISDISDSTVHDRLVWIVGAKPAIPILHYAGAPAIPSLVVVVLDASSGDVVRVGGVALQAAR